MTTPFFSREEVTASSQGRPLVSVIMPVYNAGSYLRPAVESVLSQTYSNWELLLIDDGSTDGCVESIVDIADSRIRRVRQQNAGKPATMNRGIAIARGEFYALQDADDVGLPTRLERQVACLVENPHVAGAFCGHELILEDKVLAPTFRAKSVEDCAREIAAGHMPAHDPTGMYRLSMVRDFKYCEELLVGEGTDYIFRIGEQFPLMVVGECLYQYRIHWQSLTRRDPEVREKLIQEVFDRMRERHGLPRQREPSRGDDNGLAGHFMISVADHVMARRRMGAIRAGLQCLRMRPTSAGHALPLLYAMIPRFAVVQYRRAKELHVRRRLARAAGSLRPPGANAP